LIATGIDHPLVAAADLEKARTAFAALGFTLSPRGRHKGWGTANYCVMFPADYVEILGLVDASQPSNGLEDFLATHGEGLMTVALATGTGGAMAAAARLAALGFEAPVPSSLSRLLEAPEGTREPAFRLLPPPPGLLPGIGNTFFCEHLTPELLREPGWLKHANGAVGLEGLTFIVEDPLALEAQWRRLVGKDAVFTGKGRLDITLGRHDLRFLDRGRAAKRYPELALPGHLPAPFVMSVLVKDLAATGRYLSTAGIPTSPAKGKRLVIPPQFACGTVVEFCES
jgi:hypothetical protein